MRAVRGVGALLVLLVVAPIVAGCTTPAASHTPVPMITLEPEPERTEPPTNVAPSPSPGECADAVERVGTFVVRIGTPFAELRTLILSDSFDAVATLAAMRHLSALMDVDADLVGIANACPSMSTLAPKIEAFRAAAGTAIAAAIAAGFEPAGQRAAAVQMFRTLRALVRISAANAVIADALHLHTDLLELPPGTTDPLGPLPSLPA